MFTGLVHDLGVFYLLSRAAAFPELVNDKAEMQSLLVQWHDNIGHALLSALGSPESVLEAVLAHETEREITEVKTLSDVIYVANKIANRTSFWRDPAFGDAVDTSMLDTLFDVPSGFRSGGGAASLSIQPCAGWTPPDTFEYFAAHHGLAHHRPDGCRRDRICGSNSPL